MKLSYRLFISYLFVVLIGLLVLAMSTAFVAPANFVREMSHMGRNFSNMRGAHQMQIIADLEAGFRHSLNSALIFAGIAATLAAGGASWFVSKRIVNPIRALVTLSQRIANGHYEQRLQLDTGDELAELVHNFNQMAASLAETEKVRQRLFGDVTHELKTPLASIKGYMEGLQDNVIPATPETFQLIHNEADRLQRLVQDLQELSRAEAGQIQLNLSAVEPHQIVLPVVGKLRPQYAEKGVVLEIEIPDDLPKVRADLDRTTQILTNLLGNALQNTPSGTVTVRAEQRGRELCFTVRDTGIGLEAADLQRIFERFYRVDKSRSRASGGSGIGLTVAKQLVEMQGGSISATSGGPGKGSEFRFTLPVS
jgi:histidine kinase